MAKPKLPTNSFFSGFQTSDDDTSPKADINNEEVEETEEVEEKEEEVIEEEREEESGEEKEEELEFEDDPFINTINFLAEEGIIDFDEDKVYEEEGEELLKVVFQESLEKEKQNWINEIPEDFQSIIKHIKAGGTLEDWVEAVKPTDFDSINVEDEETQKQLIEDHLKLTGMDDEDIKERLQELEDAGTLEKNAKTAVKYLKKAEENKVKEYEKELDAHIENQKKAEAKALEDFKTTVLSTEDLKGFKLKDKVQRQELFDYITKPVKNGKSKYVIDNEKVDNQLALAYMSMKGFSFKDLEKAVESKTTSKLRSSLSRITDPNARSSGGVTRKEPTQSAKIPKGPWAITRNDD